MSALELKVYEILKQRFSEQEASTLLELFDAKAEQKFNERKESFVTSKDKESLKTISNAKDLFATKEDLSRIEGHLRKEIAESKSDIIKWMFLFCIGQIAATISLMMMFIKK
jgi:ATP phosphoribosyltransferase regulatory subunit HisZ